MKYRSILSDYRYWQIRLTDLNKCYDSRNYEGMKGISIVKVHLKFRNGNINIGPWNWMCVSKFLLSESIEHILGFLYQLSLSFFLKIVKVLAAF